MELDKRIQSALKLIQRQRSSQQLALLPATQVNDGVKAISVYRHDKPVLRAKSQIDQKHASADTLSRLTMEGPPELSSCLFSLPKRRPGNYSQPEVTQKTTRAPNYQFPMPKTMPWETTSSPRSSRTPPELPNCQFSSAKRCPGNHFQPEVAQKTTRRQNDALGARF